ncbi:hypothetical protein LTR37_009966 [Vermiconidia calcicola]|uniref:Uncharacterized protein n=1 Tax=Vermiconidia calcicola TaxID=1690605 RepID=A0ACC3N6B4_9PEZI|nr:hypothetical protein LTR37_009966 [Vermiconidia calcicola]
MNNGQFRRLFADQPNHQNGGSPTGKAMAPPTSLGAKKSSFMPMTPRTVKGGIDVDFARQVRERNASLQPNKKQKQFKSATPRGVKYASGYIDRAKARAEAGEAASGEDDKAARIQALEEQMKLGQISEEVFASLREEITGGEVESTHLVKGLDWKLLERVKRGEDVLGTGGGGAGGEEGDVDEELDKLGEKDVEAVQREKVQKRGEMAPPAPVAGVKRSRNEIMAELKAQRQAAMQAKAAPALDTSKWRKVGDKKSKIEIDHKGREVLITVDEDGTVKKRVRKAPARSQDSERNAIEMPDVSKPVLGADAMIPEARETPAEDNDDSDDIFEGVGTEYNPLGDGLDNDDDSDEESEERGTKHEGPTVSAPARAAEEEEQEEEEEEGEVNDGEDPADQPPLQNPPAPAQRNYFKDTVSTTAQEPTKDRLAGVQDLLKKAAKMDTQRSSEADPDNEAEQARLKRRAEMLAQQDRDLEDMDMGFGGGRFDDEGGDEEGKKVKLSEWKGSGENGWEEGEGGGKEKKERKRKPKKRKGDASSMTDIMRVIEGRKEGGSGGGAKK